MKGKDGEVVAFELPSLEMLCEKIPNYSNADLEAVTLLALDFMSQDTELGAIQAMQKAVDDFMPPQEHEMIAFMEMLAVSETSRRSLLPDRFKSMSLADIQNKLRVSRTAALSHK